jgi:methionyl aminopeptidase
MNKMRPPGLLVWEAHRRTGQRIRPGITTRELDAVVEQLFQERGAVPLFKGTPGKVPFPAVSCISVNDEVVHGIPRDRVLKEGDIVSLDTGCKLNGWCGDAAVTHAVGQVHPDVQRLLDVTQDVLKLAIDQMGKQSMWSQVARQMAMYVSDHGFATVESFVGHGIGREMHEPPQAPNFLSPDFERDNDFPLRPGLVLAIEPMVNIGRKEVRCLEDHWTQVTRDGSWSAHFEHTVALTRDGPRVLTEAPAAHENLDDCRQSGAVA